MTRPGNFGDLIDLLDGLDVGSAETARPARQIDCPSPSAQSIERSERQWIVSGILRFAFTPGDDSGNWSPSPSRD